MQRALTSHQGPQGTRGRVEEVGGQALRHLLVRSDPYPRARCVRSICPLDGAPEAPRPAPTRPSSQGACRVQARQASQQAATQPTQPHQHQQPLHPLLAKQKEEGCRSQCYGDHHNYEWYCTRCDMAIMANHKHHNHQDQDHYHQDQDNSQHAGLRRDPSIWRSPADPPTPVETNILVGMQGMRKHHTCSNKLTSTMGGWWWGIRTLSWW